MLGRAENESESLQGRQKQIPHRLKPVRDDNNMG